MQVRACFDYTSNADVANVQARQALAVDPILSVTYADGHPLNDGQIAGIVVGSIVGGLLLICLAVYVARQCCCTAKSAQANLSVYM